MAWGSLGKRPLHELSLTELVDVTREDRPIVAAVTSVIVIVVVDLAAVVITVLSVVLLAKELS